MTWEARDDASVNTHNKDPKERHEILYMYNENEVKIERKIRRCI